MNSRGTTQKPNIKLQYEKLALLAKEAFSIDISADKMLLDEQYQSLVLNELGALEHDEISALIVSIKQVISNNAQPANTNSQSNAKPTLFSLPLYLLLAVIMVVGLIGGWLFLQPAATPSSSPSESVVQSSAVNTPIINDQTTIQNIASAQPAPSTVLTLPVSAPKLAFKIHGSNTIGEKLAPALIEGFLKTQGVETFYWQTTDESVEKTLQYIKNNQAYAVELHAHGSSTAFSDLLSGRADIGMASRRVKRDEVQRLLPSLGDLSKVGNEHIIGLDGLAIIVNQNNTLKSLSTENLAKVFAGEIANWSELGGPDLPIKVFARDKKSGTWDTFKNLVLKKFKKNLVKDAQRLESSSDLSTLVSQDESAIGFIGLSYIRHNKALSISEGEGTTSIFPTRFTIGTEDYALSRRLYLYTPTQASDLIKDFASYAISREGQSLVEDTGLISQNIRIETVYPLDGAPRKYNEYTREAKRLSLNFHFNYADKVLDNKGKRDLQRLIEFMEENPGRRLVLMGFSDSIGNSQKNKLLSLKRAMAVEKELISRGVHVMSVEGFGELLPIANNETEVGRERNRRVEVWLM
ncbi:substrate-binding domain-containing protein [Algibacillus agarilyticus]|uniref:substrate-binding domain-containing protein n=1 Tax=Algibacillus agarilyticus TaxID=2234133 RepID=UPI000DD0A394|nr:phosphate ABC transporter substrate-binding/OmpA family protein [Algibacillus agarilyticus]